MRRVIDLINCYLSIYLCVTAKQFKYPDSEHRKPPVPRPDDRPVMGLRTTKNFVTQNAVDNIMSVARRPDKTYVDTRRGDKHCLIPSGLEPVYTHKKVNPLLPLTNVIRYDTCADKGQFILSTTRKRKYKQKKNTKVDAQ